ncbi:MAG: sugar nucleotide-binding protein, partial [Planctomycetota bacterium]|nr:sugar nucleotide-binding protein [Planctomycetota bacterium]
MKVLIIGANGQLGTDLIRAASGHEILAFNGRSELDVTSATSVLEAI